MADLTFVLDCRDPAALAPFWCAALRYTVLHEGDPYVVIVADEPAGGKGPVILLQGVPEPKTGKNRMHLDIHTDELESEVDRLTSLGATVVSEGPREGDGFRWVVLGDPEGNEFCVCKPLT